MAISKAQQKATTKKKKENYDTTVFRCKKGELAKIKAYAESIGKSFNGYLNDLIKEDMEKHS